MRGWTIGLVVAVFLSTFIGVAPANDREMAEEIATKLRLSGQLQGYDIRVKVERGTAWLRGRVADHRQRTAALTAAFQTEGVEKVVDNLTVRAQAQKPQYRTAVPAIAPPRPVHHRTSAAPQYAARPLPPASPAEARPIPTQTRQSRASTSTKYLGRPSVPMPPKPLDRIAAYSEPKVPAPAPIPTPRQTVPDWDRGDVGMASTDTTENARIKMAMQSGREAGALPKPATPEVRPMPPVKPVRRPNPTTALPATAQKASYTAGPSQGPATSMQIASALAGAAQPKPLPSGFGLSAGEAVASDGFSPTAGEAFVSDSFAAPAGEAFASDSGEESPGLLSTEFGASAMESLGTISLRQPVPRPIRRNIVGQTGKVSSPQVRTSEIR